MTDQPSRACKVSDQTLLKRGRTAMLRYRLSRPAALAVELGLVDAGTTYFDYGCGRGSDVSLLNSIGVKTSGWDPFYCPWEPLLPADVVGVNYVLNVIRETREREEIVLRAWKLAQRMLLISVRTTWDKGWLDLIPVDDGHVTRNGSFQKFFDHDEFIAWIRTTITNQLAVLGPGIVACFREPQDLLNHLVRSSGTGVTHETASVHGSIKLDQDLAALNTFLCERGRPPEAGELLEGASLIRHFGSLRRAMRVLERQGYCEHWARTAIRRQNDMLVAIALAHLAGIWNSSRIPGLMRVDARAFFGSYSKASELGIRILLGIAEQNEIDKSCKAATVGKRTPQALYLHRSAVHVLDPLLRVVEGAARAIVGDIPSANVIKLNRHQPQVSYLSYSDFDEDAHPVLVGAHVVDLVRQRSRHHDFGTRSNPPVLHRKDTLVLDSHPNYGRFRRLTSAEEKAGLLSPSHGIGNRLGWQQRLELAGWKLRGHRLVRSPARPSS